MRTCGAIVDETIRLANIGVIGQAMWIGTEKSVRDAIQGGYTELSPLPDDVLAEMREIAVTRPGKSWPPRASVWPAVSRSSSSKTVTMAAKWITESARSSQKNRIQEKGK